MPGDTAAQLEGNGLAIRCRFPGFREARGGIAGGIQIHQRFLDFATHDVNAGGSLQAWVQDSLFGREMHRHDAPPARLFLREGGFWCDDIGGQSGGSQQQGAAVHFHRSHPFFQCSETGLRAAGARVNRWRNAAAFISRSRHLENGPMGPDTVSERIIRGLGRPCNLIAKSA